MKNSDMPAMPVIDNEQSFPLDMERYGSKSASTVFAFGLTKREMMSMHMMASLVSPMIDDVLQYKDSSEWLNNMTESAVEMADALLAELDRTAK